ncbi:F-box/FBD/LRR-repeat protein At1g78750-like [Bidens hawaiensis]|uniref:F-box/FBD/LRR-repeat protein At1g78750-like n=1 Tax=Bidens hawaiensis TaxID=980011 RepID=UPI00404B08F8
MLRVRELDIQYKFFELPSSLFSCTTLTKLKICLGPFWECVSAVNLPCLKILDVAVRGDPFSRAFKLIAGSPMLENLTLGVSWCHCEGDYIFDIPTLRRLKLKLFSSPSSHINKLVLRVPKLEHLYFDGTLDWLFVMEDVLSLVEASFSFRENSFNNNFMVELLNGISGVKLLSLEKVRDGKAQDSSLLKIISASPMTIFPNMVRLELKGYWRFELIPKFLESFPELKELYIEKFQYTEKLSSKVIVCANSLYNSYFPFECDFHFVFNKWYQSEVSMADFQVVGGVKKLHNQNYKSWSTCISSYLQGHDLWVVVNGGETVQPANEDANGSL